MTASVIGISPIAAFGVPPPMTSSAPSEGSGIEDDEMSVTGSSAAAGAATRGPPSEILRIACSSAGASSSHNAFAILSQVSFRDWPC